MKSLFLSISLFIVIFTCAQPASYSIANAHSHNDYEQKVPFLNAYNEQFGSIEADIYLIKGKILVGHDIKDLTDERSLENLYLKPLSTFNHKNRSLQILIDIKSEAINTLDSLISLLKKYPAIINNKSIHFVISGNRPAENLYKNYPSFIMFDGRIGKEYSAEELNKIALLSEDYGKFTMWKKTWPMLDADREKIVASINKAHELKKPVRLWGSPDYLAAWEEMMKLKVDFINTDHINELSDFLTKQDKSLRLLPYNRIIKSAGDVIRYGKPELENHALDVAVLSEEGIVVVEDRYGISAIDVNQNKVVTRWSYSDMQRYGKYMSTYSGIKSFKENDQTWIVWTAADKDAGKSALMIAEWNNGFQNISDIQFEKINQANNAIPNEVVVNKENNNLAVYVTLNGNDEVAKIDWQSKKISWKAPTSVAPYGLAIANGKVYVSNWAGKTATDSLKERAGVPWGLAYTDPRTGATAGGSVSVIDATTGKKIKEIIVGQHPNMVKVSTDQQYVYVANGSSDEISVINTKTNTVVESIYVGLLKGKQTYQGSTPNGMHLSADNTTLYVSNGLDNAVAVVQLGKTASIQGKGKSIVSGYIPTEAYPAGLTIIKDKLVVTNLESDGANVVDLRKNGRSIHNQLASVSIIPLPNKDGLENYTQQVSQLNLMNRTEQLMLPARKNMAPVPVPERLGEPSVFKHVVYIIKENKTYDQVFGDMKTGRGDSSLCVFGEKITPNIHSMARQFGWMDDYHASGKSSAEGHQWTDAGMVSDYVEKNVRAWYRSYPHRQEDALVYNKSGFIWNQALDHGKTVRIYGEACETEYDRKLKWLDLYNQYTQGQKPNFVNKSTIARIRPIISPTFPDCDNIAFSDQQRADIFMEEWKNYEKKNNLPNLMVVSLPNDHSAGTSPDFPTPNAMVADNDLAVGRIVEMISKSKYWDSTVIFITQDDSQGGWDHISAYRTVGLTVSAYSTGKLITSNYNQTSMLRTIEQILGIPPMNIMDATARLMTDCFQNKINKTPYQVMQNNIPLNQMNKPMQSLSGKARRFAKQSQNEVYNEVDGGEDDKMNRIIWFYSKGNEAYPGGW
jgi:YVTN family beta-propeller protein